MQRLRSLDAARGLIMLLMVIDHVRVYSGVPAGGPDPAVFFTRWVTHFCAPGFVFFAGTSAYLYGQRLGDRAALSRWLLSRGALLVLLDLTVMRLFWTFNLDFAHYLLAGVLWAIGWSMVLLAGLVWLPLRAIAGVGVSILCLHNLLDTHFTEASKALVSGSLGWLWQVLYFGSFQSLGPLVILYVLIPWVGVMAAGYAFASLLRSAHAQRACLLLGGGAVAAFVLLRALDGYGDPRQWHGGPAQMAGWLRFLNTTKYPASLDYLLMTLGPLLLALPLLVRVRGRATDALELFGRVPLFFYVLHIPLIHAAAILVSLLRTGGVELWLFANHPMRNGPAPAGYSWSLPLLYLVVALVSAALYWPSRWYAERRTA